MTRITVEYRRESPNWLASAYLDDGDEITFGGGSAMDALFNLARGLAGQLEGERNLSRFIDTKEEKHDE